MDPRTHKTIEGPRLFKRIGEALRNGEINIKDLPVLVGQYGINAQEAVKLFEDAATYGGRTLQALSSVEAKLQKMLPDIVLSKREITLWERFKVGYLAVDNFRRGLLVTQLATAARNAITQTGRYSLETLNDGMNGVISTITGEGQGFTPFFEDMAATLRKMSPGNTKRLKNMLAHYPLENARLYNTPVGDVALTNKVTNFFNAFNRGQEYFFRNLIVDAKLHAAAKKEGVHIHELSVEAVSKAVDEALDWTFAKSPSRGSFGRAFFDHLSQAHKELSKKALFAFVKTLNLPDEVYKLPLKDKLNFFRVLEDGAVNVVGTGAKGDGATAHQVVTSFLTTHPKYLANIKKTAEAVYLNIAGETPLGMPSSPNDAFVHPSPPAGGVPNKRIPGVSDYTRDGGLPGSLIRASQPRQAKSAGGGFPVFKTVPQI